jgi:NAD(P)H-quinone oxidoreductase subunit N
MALLTTGRPFVRAVETSSAVAVYAPLEGGFEGRYQRRLRASGYTVLSLTARGLGDLGAYLTDVHGVRPAHLGKKSIGQEAAVGPVYFVPPIADYSLGSLPPKSKGLVLWLLEGFILSQTEIDYLLELARSNSSLKIVVEMGGERYFRWQPLAEIKLAA